VTPLGKPTSTANVVDVTPALNVAETITAADRVAAVFRLPDPPKTASGSEPSSMLLGWVLGAIGLVSFFLAKTADV
jgi:hypothetical protein